MLHRKKKAKAQVNGGKTWRSASDFSRNIVIVET